MSYWNAFEGSAYRTVIRLLCEKELSDLRDNLSLFGRLWSLRKLTQQSLTGKSPAVREAIHSRSCGFDTGI